MLADLQADLLADQAEGAPAIEPVPTLAIEAEAAGCLLCPPDDSAGVGDDPVLEAEMIEEVEPAGESPDRLDRVSSAVRLTREAVQAWAALLQQPDDEGQPAR